MYNKYVHRIVAEAFLPPVVGKNQVRHLDGDRLNNRASNLAWGTPKENQKDREGHPTCRAGKHRVVSHTTQEEILEAKNLLKTHSITATAKIMGRPRTTIADIANNRVKKAARD